MVDSVMGVGRFPIANRMRIAAVERLTLVEPDRTARPTVGDELPAPKLVAEPFAFLPIVLCPQQIAGPTRAIGQRGHLEVAVQNQLRIQPAFARVVDLLEENPMQRRRHGVSRVVCVHNDAHRLRGTDRGEKKGGEKCEFHHEILAKHSPTQFW